MIDKYKRKCRMKHRTETDRSECSFPLSLSRAQHTHIHSSIIESCWHTPLSRKNRFLMSMCSRATSNYYINTREKKKEDKSPCRLARALTIEWF